VLSQVQGLVAAVRSQTDDLARAAAAEASAPVELLEGYADVVLAAAASDRRVGDRELERFRSAGERAAGSAVPLGALLDLFLSATRLYWETMGRSVQAATPEAVALAAGALFRASDDIVAALAQGYQDSQRLAIRQQEATRREFVDDLLAGGGEGTALEQRAADFGFNASGAHTVLVVRAERPLHDAGPVQDRVENQVQSRFGRRDVVVATKDGLLVCIFPSRPGSPEPAHELAGFLSETTTGAWQVGVGRPGSGLGGVARSYREARETLDLAERLGVADPLVRVDGLMAFRLLGRDPSGLAEVVRYALGGLGRARGGPEHLVQTLEAYFAEGGNTTATARRLHVTPRAVTYRLEAIRRHTGYRAREPRDAFVLQVALWGRRLLEDSLPGSGN
jgi:hypothetical protein